MRLDAIKINKINKPHTKYNRVKYFKLQYANNCILQIMIDTIKFLASAKKLLYSSYKSSQEHHGFKKVVKKITCS